MNDGDTFDELAHMCGPEWEFSGYPAAECEKALHAHMGVETSDWDDVPYDLEYLTKGAWALARAPLDMTRREEMYSTVMSGITHSTPGRSQIRLGRAQFRVDHGVAAAGCTLIHEGRHSSYGGHDVEGKYDVGHEGPNGWCLRFVESFARLEVDGGEAAYKASRVRLYIK